MRFLLAILFVILARPVYAERGRSTVRVKTWDERMTHAFEVHEATMRACFRGVSRTSSDVYPFQVFINTDGRVTQVNFPIHKDEHVAEALACVGDELVMIRFPPFEGVPREVEFNFRPLGSDKVQMVTTQDKP